jgi:ribosomal protein L40E
MEMIIIAVVAVVAFAAVLVPLFRRGAGASSDASEFGSPADRPPPKPKPRQKSTSKPSSRTARPVRGADPEGGAGIVPPMVAGPATPVAPTGATVPDAPAEPAVPDARAQSRPEAAGSPDALERDDALEHDVARYRAALRAGTICRKCGEANPPGSRFCADCGSDLPVDDAQEFT